MNSNLKRKLAISAAGAIVLGGAGGTYAATRGGGDDEREAFVAAAAKRLDVSPEKLKGALEGAFSDRLDAAVKAGRLTQKQADEIKRRAKEHGGLPPFGPGGPHHFKFRGGPDGPGGPLFGGFEAAAKYLGLSREALHRQLHSGSGKSLADVAKAHDKSIDGLEDAMKDGVRTELEKAVDAKRLTDAQRDRMLERLDDRIDDIVKRKHGRRPGGDERGFRFREGPPPGPGFGPGAGPPPGAPGLPL